MTDDQHGEGTPPSGGRWDPLPQGDYDDGATAFVKLPEGGIDALLAAADSPLAAPGHGYVPPRITTAPDQAGGEWAVPEGGQWPDPNALPYEAEGDADRFTYRPGAAQQWSYDAPQAPAQDQHGGPAQDASGQWSIPLAGGDLPDESGEFTTSSLVQQWGGTPPATLPGGASAPWATEPTEPTGPTGPTEPTQPGPPDRPGHAGQPWGHEPGAPEHGHGGPQHGTPPHGVPAHGTPAHGTPAHGMPVADAHAPVAPDTADTGSHLSRDPEAGPPYGEFPAGTGADGAWSGPQAPEAASGASREPAEADEPTEPPEAVQEPAEALEGPAEPDPAPAAPADGPVEEAGSPDGAAADEELPPPPGEEHPLASYVLRVNGVERPVTDAWIGESLLYVLRERLGLAGAKDGCSQGECGACNVQVDGRLVASCLVPAVTAAGSEVRTVEGLAEDGRPSDVQRALARCGAVQCGFCVPGMAMTLHDLLEGNPAPTELETRQALCGNLCRCSGYRGVLDAVSEVVAEREALASSDAEHEGDEPRIPHQAGPGSGGVNPSAFDPTTHDQAYGQDGGQA